MIELSPRKVRFAIAVFALCATSACSSGGGSTASHSPSGGPSHATWPSGQPVPATLSGTWQAHNAEAGTFRASLILNGNGYRVGGGGGSLFNSGNVVMQGDKMLFFNGSGCGLAPPAGVGTYRWSLSGSGTLSLQLVGDSCGRVGDLGDSTWDRIR